ncbi:DUF1275 domain-containing protein [Psychromonas sp. psych-6C06]|uniref:YoaK family protein n=1 Tax=Psychromonas sp. psych-6C06 TaxID=2058089 RepID=UPI000C3338A6|nr:YoaK family protein [Psychromonas sp. psych-6C06]PKF60245.1 DUF1275 domain-containing protein [Psychromonas sp. psych-6C06]
MSRLPRWIEYGAFILAFIAGYVNATGLLAFAHQAVSHLSGTATLVGIGLITASFSDVLHLVLVLFSFFIGSALSGFLLHNNNLQLGRHYDTALLLEAILLFLSIYLLTQGSLYGQYIISAACGLQNAMATSYSGAIVRTTHLTGIFTDLGIMLGARARGKVLDKRKLLLFSVIIGGFIIGASLGSYLYQLLLFNALFIPASGCLLLAIVYARYNQRRQNKPY